MRTKSLISALALSASLVLGGSAFAQTMMGDMQISDEDLPAVTERCNQLLTAEKNETLAPTQDNTDTDNAPEGDAGSANADIDQTEKVNEVADATATIDLDTVTLEMCKDAGIGAAM